MDTENEQIECPECGWHEAWCIEEGYDSNDDLYYWEYECINCHHEWTETQPGDFADFAYE